MQVNNKIAIVTGASSGIGLATARRLTARGAKVALAARSDNKLEMIAGELAGALAVPTDMTKPEQVKKMADKVIKHYGRIDILVNNAGQGYDAPVEDIDLETFYQIFELDVAGALAAMQAVIPIMRKQGAGAIVNVSSGTALMSLPNMGGYSAMKRALAGLSLTAREELKDDNIEVSVVYPYITKTDFEKNTIKHGKQKRWNGGSGQKAPDSAEYVAEKILEAIESSEAEVYAHNWMKPKT